MEISASDLALGDIVEMKAGDMIRADIRIIKSDGFKVKATTYNINQHDDRSKTTYHHLYHRWTSRVWLENLNWTPRVQRKATTTLWSWRTLRSSTREPWEDLAFGLSTTLEVELFMAWLLLWNLLLSSEWVELYIFVSSTNDLYVLNFARDIICTICWNENK